ncbi:MAG: NAD(P)H-binding protein [Myxococcota bacterium]|nr:NAD(P)H-binding protein [Myxococcota bacterium]
MTRILVTGANGNLGRLLLRELGAAGARAVVRSERAAATVRALPDAPEVAIVDYTDPDGVARAAEGCTAVVHLVGILKATRSASYEDAHERTASALATAAQQVGIERVVYLSILGSRPDAANACLASKGRAEQILLESPVGATILRVPMVLGGDDPATWALRARTRGGIVPLVRGGASLEQPIDALDVVRAIRAALERPSLAGHQLDLAGPESLPHRELLRRAAALRGTRVRIVPVPRFLVGAFAALVERLAANPPLTSAMLGVLEHDDRIDAAATAKLLGIELTPLDETLRRCVGPEA